MRALVEAQLAAICERAHARDGRRLCAELRAPVHERHALRLAAELERPVERAVAAAGDQHVLAVEFLCALHAIEELAALISLGVRNEEPARLERPEAAGNDDAAGVEPGAGRGLDVEAAIAPAARGTTTSWPRWNPAWNGLICSMQPVDQFLRAADRQRRDVVDRLVGIELGALAARMRERIHDFALEAEKPELENGEEPDGAGADDDALRADGGSRCGFAHDGIRGPRPAACAARAAILPDDRLAHGPRTDDRGTHARGAKPPCPPSGSTPRAGARSTCARSRCSRFRSC